MRILLLTQWFEPEPAFKGLAFARELRNAGHSVEVLTGYPNYPEGVLYPGFSMNWRDSSTVDGIRIIRVPLYPSHNASTVPRALNYLSFAASSCLYGCVMRQKPDVMYVYHPPMTVGISAAIISICRRIPFVIDINDLWPESLSATGMISTRWLLSLIGIGCRWVYRRASYVVSGTPGTSEVIHNEGVPSEKLAVIYNWCDEESLQISTTSKAQAKRGDGDREGSFRVVFAGNMGKAQALTAVLYAARLVQEREPRVRFVFVGGGLEVENLKTTANTLEIDNVSFIPRVPMAEVAQILETADVLLVHLKDDPLFRITIPSKTQAYMHAGKPILMAVGGDASDLVRWARAGYVASPENPESIANAVTELARMSATALAEMGARGRAYYDQHLSLSSGTGKFLALFERTIRPKSVDELPCHERAESRIGNTP